MRWRLSEEVPESILSGSIAASFGKNKGTLAIWTVNGLEILDETNNGKRILLFSSQSGPKYEFRAGSISWSWRSGPIAIPLFKANSGIYELHVFDPSTKENTTVFSARGTPIVGASFVAS